MAEPSIATLLRGPLESLGLDADVTKVAAVALALLLATAETVFGELVPKNIALLRPAGSVVWVVIPLVVFTKPTRPLIAVLNGSANQLLRLVGVEPVLGSGELITRPQYSDRHPSASVASIVGGGQRMARPGAISCAHRHALPR